MVKVVGGIGEAFGIQDLNLGTAGVGDSSKVQVSGGNIGKRLQVKYGVGLFDGSRSDLALPLNATTLFQSVTSTNQVFDLLYKFEF